MAKARTDLGYRKILLEKTRPNGWNPNKMPQRLFEKLERGISEVIKKVGSIPPIVVRPMPGEPDIYQIIDGWHRWKVAKNLGYTDIDAFVVDVDDQTAKILTANLNYLRGEKEPTKYAELLADLIESSSITDIAELIPEDQEDIRDFIITYGEGDSIRKLLEAEKSLDENNPDKKTPSDDDIFVELSFNVSVSQAKIVKAELKRISSCLKGANIEGRALEFMAVQSGQSDLPPDLVPDVPPKKPDGKKTTAKDRAKAKLRELGAKS